jgi:hypothetical protein
MKSSHPSSASRSPSRRALGGLLACGLLATGAASADVIADFNVVGARTMTTAPGAYPAVTAEERRTVLGSDLATMHAAMYDAVVAIAGGYEPFAIVPVSPGAGASQEAAAAAAACTVLAGLFPNRAPEYAADCAPYQPGAGSGGVAAGITLGIEVGQKMLAERADDGRSTIVAYAPVGGVGRFEPFPVGSSPVNFFMPAMRPFTLTSAMQFRADGPPDLTSASYAYALNEVKHLGAAGGAALTADQQEIARFHTENPNTLTTRNLRVFLNQPTVLENARLAAMFWVAYADAMLGCFESKYYFDRWRPRAAIPAAGADGNPATEADPAWTPFVNTPNHPEYPAAHACFGGVTTEILKAYFKTPRVRFTWNSTVTGTSREYASVYAMLKEEKLARIYGGMHFRFASDDGATLGRRTGRWVAKNYFQPVKRKHGKP